jgi:hypothetical protein
MRLRADLQVEPDGAGLRITDAVTRTRLSLGPEGAAVWRALAAGASGPAALRAALPALSPTRLRAHVRVLADALAFDDERWRGQAPLFAAPTRAAAPLPLRLHPALRHRCVGCGSSCLGVDIGPVGPETEAAVAAHGLWRALPDAGDPGDAFVDAEVEGRTLRFLRRREGACFALRADGLCGVHGAAGADAKPPVCRQFPYTFVRGPDAVYVGLQMECRSFPASAAAAQSVPVGDETEALARFVERGAVVFDLPDPVPVAPGLYVAASDWAAWWAALCAAAESAPEPDAAFAAVADVARRLVAGRAATLGGAPAWLDAAAWGVAEPDPDAERARLLDALAETCAGLAEEHAAAGHPLEAALLGLTQRALLVLAGELPLPRVRWTGDGPALLRTWLLAEIHGQEPVRRDDLLAGLGRLGLRLRVAGAATNLRAFEVARLVAHPQDANDALVAVNKTLRSPPLRRLLDRERAALRQLLR